MVNSFRLTKLIISGSFAEPKLTPFRILSLPQGTVARLQLYLTRINLGRNFYEQASQAIACVGNRTPFCSSHKEEANFFARSADIAHPNCAKPNWLIIIVPNPEVAKPQTVLERAGEPVPRTGPVSLNPNNSKKTSVFIFKTVTPG